jgi:predicted phage terminase large subunit-like protein
VPLDYQPADQDILDALLRENLASFIHKTFNTVVPGESYLPNWHIQHVAWQLTRVRRGEVKRLMILLPPRSLKSVCASVAFPAWVLGHDPTAKIVCVSYAESLARKHALDCRSVVSADWYKRAFGGTRIDPSKNTELEFMTTRRGYRLATSVGGTLTGRGGNLIIIDDPMKPEEAMSQSGRAAVNQWYTNTLLSRLNNKVEDAIVLVMQRLHADDLAGHILENEDWTVVTIPAIAKEKCQYELGAGGDYVRRSGELIDPRRDSMDILDSLKEQMGTLAFSAQYQQIPVPSGGTMVSWDKFERFSMLPSWDEDDPDIFVHSWDTATKAGELNDYSVGTIWLMRKNQAYLLDVVRERLNYPDLRQRVIDLATAGRYKAKEILIEDAGSGASLVQELRRHTRLYPTPIKPTTDKVTRMWTATLPIENSQVYIPEKAEWLDEFQEEVMRFPHARYDDQVDSMAQFLNWWRNYKRRIFSVTKLAGW